MQKIEELLQNEDLVKIANSAAQQFSEDLSQDEIKTCIMSAMWQANKKFDETRNTKFSTYLYKSVLHECARQKKILSKEYINIYSNYSSLKNSILRKNNYSEFAKIEMIDEIKSCSDPELLFDKFYNNLSLNEMAKKHGVSKETVRFKIKKNLNSLKVKLS